jgi:hypothetical protein
MSLHTSRTSFQRNRSPFESEFQPFSVHDSVDISFSHKFEIPILKRTENNRSRFARKDPDLVSDLQRFSKETIS